MRQIATANANARALVAAHNHAVVFDNHVDCLAIDEVFERGTSVQVERKGFFAALDGFDDRCLACGLAHRAVYSRLGSNVGDYALCNGFAALDEQESTSYESRDCCAAEINGDACKRVAWHKHTETCRECNRGLYVAHAFDKDKACVGFVIVLQRGRFRFQHSDSCGKFVIRSHGVELCNRISEINLIFGHVFCKQADPVACGCRFNRLTALLHRRHGENLAEFVDVELVAYIHGAVGNLNLQNSPSAWNRQCSLNAGIKFGSVPNGESDLLRFVGDCEHIVGVVDNQLANAHIVNANRAVLCGHFNGNPSQGVVGFFLYVFALQTELAAFEGLVDFSRIHAFAQRENAMHYRKRFGV